jgi:hypothetical protein
MPTLAPSRPTLKPLKVRNPWRHREYPDDPAANLRGRIHLHQRLRHGVESQLHETGNEQQADRERIDIGTSESAERGSTKSWPT